MQHCFTFIGSRPESECSDANRRPVSGFLLLQIKRPRIIKANLSSCIYHLDLSFSPGCSGALLSPCSWISALYRVQTLRRVARFLRNVQISHIILMFPQAYHKFQDASNDPSIVAKTSRESNFVCSMSQIKRICRLCKQQLVGTLPFHG